MKYEVGDIVLLSLSQEELEAEMANIKDLRTILFMKMDNANDKKALNKTFDVAMTAMEMVWLNMEVEQDD